MMSTSRNIIIIGSDTDIWVYGLAFLECGWINNKVVYVEKSIGSEYAHINAFTSHPKLNGMLHPLLSRVTLYILTGSDYISTFFRTSKQTFVKAFVDNLCHICPDNVFVEVVMFSIRNRWIPLQKD